MLSRISLEDGKEGWREVNKRWRDGEMGKGKEKDGGGSRGTVSGGFIPG